MTRVTVSNLQLPTTRNDPWPARVDVRQIYIFLQQFCSKLNTLASKPSCPLFNIASTFKYLYVCILTRRRGLGLLILKDKCYYISGEEQIIRTFGTQNHWLCTECGCHPLATVKRWKFGSAHVRSDTFSKNRFWGLLRKTTTEEGRSGYQTWRTGLILPCSTWSTPLKTVSSGASYKLPWHPGNLAADDRWLKKNKTLSDI